MLLIARLSRFVAVSGTMLLVLMSTCNRAVAQADAAAADISYQMPQTQNVDELAEYLNEVDQMTGLQPSS